MKCENCMREHFDHTRTIFGYCEKCGGVFRKRSEVLN